MGTLQPNRIEDSSVRIGNLAYLVGGTPSMVQPWVMVLDLKAETLSPLPTVDPNLGEIPAMVPWEGGVLMVFGKGITKLLKPDGTLVPIDVGMPADTGSGAFLLPSDPPALFVGGGKPSPGFACKPTPSLYAAAVSFWRLAAGKWSMVDGYCLHAGVNTVVGSDAVYLAPDFPYGSTTPFEPVRRLAPPGDKWEELAPVTHWRSHFGAAVVEQ